MPLNAEKDRLLRTALLIFVIAFAVYFNALPNGFVIDDIAQVIENQWIKDVRYIPEIFSRGVWDFQNVKIPYYRPLMHLVYMINYSIFGVSPWGFHLVNVILHAAVSVLVFIVTKEVFGFQRSSVFFISFVTAAIFAVHPVHTEAVTWIAGLPDISYSFFYLLSFYLYVRAGDSGNALNSSFLLSLCSFFLAALCKETALTLPILLFAYDFSYVKSFGLSFRTVKRYIPFIAVTSLYFLIRYNALGGEMLGHGNAGLDAYHMALNVFPLFFLYIEKLFFPVNLNAFYVFHPVMTAGEFKSLTSITAVIAFLIFAAFAYRKNRAFFLGMCIMTIPLLPVLYIQGNGANVFADRYMYLPAYGTAILLALAFEKLGTVKNFPSALIMTLPVIIISLYSACTVQRNAIWKSNLTIWSDAVLKSPDGIIPHLKLGNALEESGFMDRAIEQYRIVLTLNPNYAEAYNSMGTVYGKMERMPIAIEYFRTALKLEPGNAEARNNLGNAYFFSGAMEKAVEQYKISLQAQPNNANTHFNLGIAFLKVGRKSEAMEHLSIAAKLNPANDEFRKALLVAR